MNTQYKHFFSCVHVHVVQVPMLINLRFLQLIDFKRTARITQFRWEFQCHILTLSKKILLFFFQITAISKVEYKTLYILALLLVLSNSAYREFICKCPTLKSMLSKLRKYFQQPVSYTCTFVRVHVCIIFFYFKYYVPYAWPRMT